MPKFEVAVPHTMGKEAALARLQGFSERLKEKHADKIKDLEQTWNGDRLDFAFKTLGLRIEGQMHIDNSVVRVEGNLPMAASLFKGQITGAIREQLDRLIS